MNNGETSSTSRYDRQIRFSPFGADGQRRLKSSRVLIVGMGALGSTSAELLARAGVGYMRLVDRDFLDWTNLQRQSLYSEDDVRAELPKAIAAAQRLKAINSENEYEPLITDVSAANIRQLTESMDLIVDGTDNFETRFLINDIAIAQRVPWIYGGCLGCDGQTMTIVPGETACLRCLMPEGPPPAAELPTCDTAGVLGPIINLIAAVQALESIKILSGHPEVASRQLQVFALWDNRTRQIDLGSLRDSIVCPACRLHQLDWLDGRLGSQTVVLCGRNAVQIKPAETAQIDLELLGRRLGELGRVRVTPFFLKLNWEGLELTLFPDGRAIIGGTQDLVAAKRAYNQCFGN